ncbi:DNA methyltransferase [Desulfitibacter alkalitolerans]|uniref:DNA methyltransferase n=1 Tax=Desulfitibacter alkalitolerans TaxID=264641 RepID=UPI000688E32E|nr:DNA methyltransferase [Desulfitibacter alkalitolerans]
MQSSYDYREILSAIKHKEGFPKGTFQDILFLSDLPHYTLGPNPYIRNFINQYGKPYDESCDNYQSQPFAADVVEGKNDPIYRAHSYHTKVPYKAIMKYILHYTEPGDIVLDCFCGTGMTGVAAQMCGCPEEDLARQIENEMGTVRWGGRNVILNDLSPAATFIAYNYNIPVNIPALQQQAREILEEVKAECGWMYYTRHLVNGCLQQDDAGEPLMGRINYTIWSDVFICCHCTSELIFWKEALDVTTGKVKADFLCPNCKKSVNKFKMEMVKQIPAAINYSIKGKRYEKEPDSHDLEIIRRIEAMEIPYPYPQCKMPEGHNTAQPRKSHGLIHARDFYTKRALYVLAAFADKARKKSSRLLWFVTAVTEGSSRLNRERPSGLPSKLNGTLYISSMIREINVLDFLSRKIKRYKTCSGQGQTIIQTASATDLSTIADNSCDYIFTDPPFGGNIMYSELNFLWEAWLGVYTNNHLEAIINKVQKKDLNQYQQLMESSFKEMYRVLKPGRWLTLVFSNSKNQVWNAIQEALFKTGFIIADVSILNKKQGSFIQVTTNSAMKEDLAVSAYKPKISAEEVKLKPGTEEGVWDFVSRYLERLAAEEASGRAVIKERQKYTIFDRMVAFHLENNLTVPMGAIEFFNELDRRFINKDGLYYNLLFPAVLNCKKLGTKLT